MSKPGTFTAFRLDDIPEEHRQWMEPVYRQLNNVLQTHNAILNRAISVGDNLNSSTQAYAITPANGGGFPSIRLKAGVSGKPAHVIVTSATDSNGNPISLGSPAWHVDTDGSIVVSALSGLDTTKPANVQFLVLGG
jgi:hypothetical protein